MVDQLGNQLLQELAIVGIIGIGIFFVGLYIFRAIFNIPSFLRYQKAQIRLLEQIAKKQGVDESKVQSIIIESEGWVDVPPQSRQSITEK